MFLFCHSDLNIQHYFLRFFGVNWSAGALFALSESFNCSNSSLSWGMISLCIVITLGQSITDRNLHKINYTDNRTIVWVFLLVLILNLFITRHSWLANIARCMSYRFLLSHLSSNVFSPLRCKINILRQMKRFLVELMYQLPYFITLSSDRFLFSTFFSGKNFIWSPCFLFNTARFSLDTFSGSTSWVTLVCSMVCWD